MTFFVFKKIRHKLVFYMLLIGVIPLSIAMFFEYQRAAENIKEDAFEHMTSIRETRKNNIEAYFQKIREEINFFSKNKTMIEAMKNLRATFHDVKKEDVTENHRNTLKEYYQNIFINKLNPEDRPDKFVDNYFPNTDYKAIYYQYKMIAARGLNQEKKPYQLVYDYYHPDVANFLDKFGYTDVYLVDNKTGHIIYSAINEIDFATSLLDGPYSHTNLAKVFKEVRKSSNPEQIKLFDFEPYIPAYNYPTSFIAKAIFDEENINIGTMIFQIPINQIDAIMTGNNSWQKEGLGLTGESYIVGEDYLMRSDSRFIFENSSNYFNRLQEIGLAEKYINQIKHHNTTILFQKVQTAATQIALTGKVNTRILDDYRDFSVLCSFTPLGIEDVNWVLIAQIDESEVFQPLYQLQYRSFLTVIIVVIFIIGAIALISSTISNPILRLVEATKRIASGDLDTKIDIIPKDETGILTNSFNKMSKSIKVQKEKIEDQNRDIKEKNEELEVTITKVQEQKEKIELQKDNIEKQAEQLTKAYTNIQSSLNYAQRIQLAKLPEVDKIKNAFIDSFVFFKPRDVVSGDFYWFTEVDNKLMLAAADCTGHGVPGAFMSMIGSDLLNEIVNIRRITNPAKVLSELHVGVRQALRQADTDNRDGMDISICTIENYALPTPHKTLTFAGAKNPLIYISQNEDSEPKLFYIKGDKMPIGGLQREHERIFTNHIINIEYSFTGYIFSDGFQDQFGGPNGRKFMIKNLKKLILENHNLPMNDQKKVFEKAFSDWMKGESQLDDVLMMGFKI